MNSTQESTDFLQNEWAIYFFYFLLLVALFFIQKYVYLLDRKLNQAGKLESKWEGKPWPLHAGMAFGLLWFLYNTFSLHDLNFDFEIQNPVKWIILVLILAGFTGIMYESFSHFGIKTGIIRSFVLIVLMTLCFYAGFITGLFLVTIIAIGILIYFFRYFKKLFI